MQNNKSLMFIELSQKKGVTSTSERGIIYNMRQFNGILKNQ